MMTGILDLESWKVIGKGNDEIGGGCSGSDRGWVHNYSVQRRGYRGGRAGHGSRREPFPVEFQVPK
ncbi:hypothetical protein GOBAR_AA31593 [Gossypium barbadense]|uniref:Uncharacterized protein n=1 Tax=Gossypium barbadense TaxID=3634 RepID=A0A2P5WDD8_GOSBA|nr:hypothetical protein GOBAR_AA31593 [Gossypium barbadense]